jgi:hypothetical protein
MPETAAAEKRNALRSLASGANSCARFLFRIVSTVVLGLGALVLISYPLWFGLIAYGYARHRGAADPILWGQLTGCGSLILLPTCILGKALRRSAFREHHDEQAKPAPKTISKEAFEAWKTAIDVQQHFNQLELQIRNFAVTLLAAVIGAMAFAFKEHYVIAFGAATFSVAVPILCAGIIGWLAFYFMDRFWYHRLLLASVLHAVEIEKQAETSLPELGLSRAIGKGSAWKVWGFEIHSSEKIDLFYATGLTVLIVIAMAVMLATSSVPTAANPGVVSLPPAQPGAGIKP